jgi:hypothetical protein
LESQPNERDAWVKDAERWICQIHGVRQCKIDLDLNGEVTGVHVVAGMEREPRHVVRDVEGLLKARLGVNVFYKKIGVVQVVENGREEPEPADDAPRPPLGIDTHEPLEAVLLEETMAPRVQCAGVGIVARDRSLQAEVKLRAGLLEARGKDEGANHPGSELVLVGRAAVAAMKELLDENVTLTLAEIRQTEMAGESVVVAAVELVEGRRPERLFGTCPIMNCRQQAAVYAVLDALNRRISLMTFRGPSRGGVPLTS